MTDPDDLPSPGSIAMVVAADDGTLIGGRPLARMIEQEVDGPVHPVGPERDTVRRLRACPSLEDVPGPVDVVLIAAPAPPAADLSRFAAADAGRLASVEMTPLRPLPEGCIAGGALTETSDDATEEAR